MPDVIRGHRAQVVENPSGGMTADRVDVVAILFVESDPVFADMYRLKLEMDDYTVRVVRDGEEALALLQCEELPDLIFLDIRLPRMDGIALLQRLHGTERTKDLPVVILSSYGEEYLILQGMRLAAFEYLIKVNVTVALSQEV